MFRANQTETVGKLVALFGLMLTLSGCALHRTAKGPQVHPPGPTPLCVDPRYGTPCSNFETGWCVCKRIVTAQH
jgi:hypothetical protein